MPDIKLHAKNKLLSLKMFGLCLSRSLQIHEEDRPHSMQVQIFTEGNSIKKVSTTLYETHSKTEIDFCEGFFDPDLKGE